LKEDDIKRDLPGMTRQKFLYNLSRASYEKEWGNNYRKPSAGEAFLAFLYRILPKIGPLRILTFRTPTPQSEKLFEDSFNVTLDRYRALLSELQKGGVTLRNDNFDVGETTARGKYRLNDAACAQLLDRLAQKDFAEVSPELRAELLRFFSSPESPTSAGMHKKARARLEAEIEKLENATITQQPAQ
jgi:hypothetical protein